MTPRHLPSIIEIDDARDEIIPAYDTLNCLPAVDFMAEECADCL